PPLSLPSLPTRRSSDLGSSSFATAINNGSLPKELEMVEMAKLLNCSVIDFFLDEEDVAPAEGKDEDEQDILRVFRSLSRRTRHRSEEHTSELQSRFDLV